MGHILADIIREMPEMARKEREAELKAKGERLEKIETWGCGFLVLCCFAGLGYVTVQWNPFSLQRKIDRLEKRIEEMEQGARQGSVTE